MASDAERRDIERALHGGVQQDLVGLAANLEVAAASLDTDLDAARQLLDRLEREARRALTEVQDLAVRIYPSMLEAGGLAVELRAAANRAQVPTRIDVKVDGGVPTAPAVAVYCCAVDVFDRAPAGTTATVTVRPEDATIAFEIVVGTDLGTERRPPHDRVEALGGNVTITSEGDRTTVAGSMPLGR